ncbi:MAG: acyl-CoA dehydrogenase family protein [Alphaproteobacteria bacterium]
MDFAFTPEQEAIRETARRFAEDRVAPGYQAREAEARFDRSLVREMGALGLIGPELPEDMGGHGLDGVCAGIIIEEIARGDLSMAYTQLLGSLMGSVIALHARPEVARRVVPEIIAGETIVALGLTEPGGGSDAANLKLKARRENEFYVLDGEKTSTSLADQADQIVVFARTGTAAERARGVSAFLIPLDAPGITTSRFDDLGEVIIGRGSVFFDQVRARPEARLGEEGQGFHHIMRGFDYSRALIGLQCLGPAAASLEETWRYVTEREAFGKPIAKYQGVTGPLAEAETLITAARLLCYKTLWLRDNDRPHTAEAAMCKWWAPQVAFDTIHRCLLTHGHYGYTRDLPHQQRLRDVLGLQIGDGTDQIQKLVIAREKVGRVAVPYD